MNVLNNFKKPELYPEFSARQENNSYFMESFKRHCYNNMDMPTQAKQTVNIVLEHRE